MQTYGGGGLPGRRKSRCKGPKEDTHLQQKNANMTGVERARDETEMNSKRWGEGGRQNMNQDCKYTWRADGRCYRGVT